MISIANVLWSIYSTNWYSRQ